MTYSQAFPVFLEQRLAFVACGCAFKELCEDVSMKSVCTMCTALHTLAIPFQKAAVISFLDFITLCGE